MGCSMAKNTGDDADDMSLPDFPDPDWDKLLEDMAARSAELDGLIAEAQPQLDKMLAEMPDFDLSQFEEMFEGVGEPVVGEPAPPPDPNLTPRDAAAWMIAEVEKGPLHHGRVVHHLSRHFGERFIRRNSRGNRVVSIEVLQAFLALTRHAVVWVRREQFWRKRRPSDPPGRREIRG
jgi:hypothetical protein